MENQENKKGANPVIAIDVLFERVQTLTREDILKSAYIIELENKINELNETILELVSQIEVANNNKK